MFWYPTYGHPDGSSERPWFKVENELGYRADGHPAGPSSDPCFRLDGELAYPAADPSAPSFRIVGSFAYPERSERRNVPWFVIGEVPPAARPAAILRSVFRSASESAPVSR